MVRLRIEYRRNECIGAGVCAAFAPEDFIIDQDGLATLTASKQDDSQWVKEIETDEAGKQKLIEAAEGCPVRVIKVINADTGEVLAGG
jgi:ferredoxin